MSFVVLNKISKKTPSQGSNSDFYIHNASWTDKFVKNNLHIIERNHRLWPHRNRWDCDCHVIHDDDYDVQPIDFLFLRSRYEEIVLDFCNQKNLKLSHLSDLWYNYYKKNQYQEPHIHHGGGYTVVHYMIYDKQHHSCTMFMDKNIVSPEIKQGDILFFPADYEHYVPQNDSEYPRLTVAFTVTLQ